MDQLHLRLKGAEDAVGVGVENDGGLAQGSMECLVGCADLDSVPEADIRARRTRRVERSVEMAFLSPECEGLPASVEQPHVIDFTGRPVLAALHRICAELMMLIGPMLWATLIVLFVWAEFFTK